MCPELKLLINQYSKQKNKKDYIYDNRDIVKYESIIKDGLNFNLKLVCTNDLNIIFFFVFSQSKILLNLPIIENRNDLSIEYDIILESLKNSNLSTFLKKYCIK